MIPGHSTWGKARISADASVMVRSSTLTVDPEFHVVHGQRRKPSSAHGLVSRNVPITSMVSPPSNASYCDGSAGGGARGRTSGGHGGHAGGGRSTMSNDQSSLWAPTGRASARPVTGVRRSASER